MRTHCVSVRLNSTELDQLDHQRGRLPRGAHLRRAWAGARLPRPVPTANAIALNELRGLAANVNQLARHANSGQGLDLAALADQVARLRYVLAGLV